jgi:hypothetical protein
MASPKKFLKYPFYPNGANSTSAKKTVFGIYSHFMKPKKRQKLCCNCEGEIDLDVIVCPYCAADLREEKPEQRPAPASATVRPLIGGQQMSQSLYPNSFTPPETIVPAAPEPPVAQAAAQPEENPTRIIGPTLLFTIGTQLFLLGALLVLFSSKGSLILKWDARLWFLYIFAAVPFLIFGYRSISKL